MRRADTLLHPVRMRIVLALGAVTAASGKELREALPDVPQATVYRHVKALHRSGFLDVAEERTTRGAVERRYRLVEGSAVLGPADVHGVPADEHIRWFQAFCGTWIDAFSRYVRRGPNLVRDRVRYRSVPMWLSDEEAGAFAEELEALCERFQGRAPAGRERRLFGFVTLPD